MTIRAIAGLVVLNAFLLGIGAALLYALLAWRYWTDLIRLAGVAYLLGTASLFVVLTLELVVGIPFRMTTIVLSGLGIAVASIVAGRLRGQAVPRSRQPGWSFPSPTVFGAFFLAGIGVYLMALFRSSRLAPLFEWDAWQVWTQRAKGLSYFDGLDSGLVLLPSYPPGVSILQATAFEAMGSVDVVTLHLQWWFLVTGAVAAIGGLLAPVVRQSILLPILLLLLVMPGFVGRATYDAMADLPLGYLVAVAALLIVLWLQERQGWQLAAAVVLLAGAQLTKREGILLVGCVVLAALVASWPERRTVWRRLGVAAAVAIALALPWRLWFMAQRLPGDGPEAGYFDSLTLFDRFWPALELVVRTLVDYDLWLIVPVLALLAAAISLLTGARRVPIFMATFLATSAVGMAWAIWSNPSFSFSQDPTASPVVRLTGTAVLVLAVLTPLLLEQAWATGKPRPAAAAIASSRRSWTWGVGLRWAMVVVPLLAYLGSMVVGVSSFRLPGGPPTFPTAADCVVAPEPGGKVRVVFGYAESYPAATALRDRTRELGVEGADVAQDGCGRLRVFVDDVPSVAAGVRIVSSVRAPDLEPTLERDPDD